MPVSMAISIIISEKNCCKHLRNCFLEKRLVNGVAILTHSKKFSLDWSLNQSSVLLDTYTPHWRPTNSRNELEYQFLGELFKQSKLQTLELMRIARTTRTSKTLELPEFRKLQKSSELLELFELKIFFKLVIWSLSDNTNRQ